MSEDLDGPDNEDDDVVGDQEQNPELVDVALHAAVIDEDLCQLHRRKGERVQCKHEVLIGHLDHHSRLAKANVAVLTSPVPS